MNIFNDTITAVDINAIKDYPILIENYENILNYYKVEFTTIDTYFQVGATDKKKGWIIDVSVIISQIPAFLQKVIPFLLMKNACFKIPIDKDTAKDLLDGLLGPLQHGKILCIYPDTDKEAYEIAKFLVEITSDFKGPKILSDIYLGGTVYTRHGIFNPTNVSEENCSIPFQYPKGVNWPFSGLASPNLPAPKKVFKHIYKPLFVLKTDLKGNVYRGIYASGLFRYSECVIKVGNKYSFSDANGRDMHDRLVWQKELHNDLKGKAPLPLIFDLFQEDGDTYLIMEFIKGNSLYNRLKEINFNAKSWFELALNERIEILNYLLKIVSIIELLHKEGYIHRDITPGNFLIGNNQKIYLIDMELSYCVRTGFPTPPFTYGTPGFMSPQQENANIPSFSEDIFGIGALMIILFTGLSPVRFDTRDREILKQSMIFFIGDLDIAELISKCLCHNPETRPTLENIRVTLEDYNRRIDKAAIKYHKACSTEYADFISNNELIENAIKGLIKSPIVVLNQLWYSKAKYYGSPDITSEKEYSRQPGLHTGIAGVLYCLARTKRIGLSISHCETVYKTNWEYLETEYLSNIQNLLPGLYYGAAGMALAISEGIRSGLIPDNVVNRQRIVDCLSLSTENLDLASGISGQGISTLLCADYLDKSFLSGRLSQLLETILRTQQPNGTWNIPLILGSKQNKLNFRFSNGIPGIIYFLLAYHSKYPDSRVKASAIKALDWIEKNTKSLSDLFNNRTYKDKITGGNESGDERKGLILIFIKAYDLLNVEHYREIAEKELVNYPDHMVKIDFSQDTGLCGLGELYLEAFRSFRSERWFQRAAWIADVFRHTFCRNYDGSGYWVMDERGEPTADFMIGNSGVIHFLAQFQQPGKIGYRILS
jgi:serine/threonine protein kinase